MSNKAYHRIHTSDGKSIEGPVSVRWEDDGQTIAAWHMLTAEEPYTSWVGGALQIPLCLQEAMELQEAKARTDGKQHSGTQRAVT